jgi:hypothetical protein
VDTALKGVQARQLKNKKCGDALPLEDIAAVYQKALSPNVLN